MNEQTDEPGNRPHPGEKARPNPYERLRQPAPELNNNRPTTFPSRRFLLVFWAGLVITLLIGWALS